MAIYYFAHPSTLKPTGFFIFSLIPHIHSFILFFFCLNALWINFQVGYVVNFISDGDMLLYSPLNSKSNKLLYFSLNKNLFILKYRVVSRPPRLAQLFIRDIKLHFLILLPAVSFKSPFSFIFNLFPYIHFLELLFNDFFLSGCDISGLACNNAVFCFEDGAAIS